jgi:hypothetical protein
MKYSGVFRPQTKKTVKPNVTAPEGKFKCKNKTIKQNGFDAQVSALMSSVSSGTIKGFLKESKPFKPEVKPAPAVTLRADSTAFTPNSVPFTPVPAPVSAVHSNSY